MRLKVLSDLLLSICDMVFSFVYNSVITSPPSSLSASDFIEGSSSSLGEVDGNKFVCSLVFILDNTVTFLLDIGVTDLVCFDLFCAEPTFPLFAPNFMLVFSSFS
uniref:Putative secreted protein n=1 Tax=Panstrongylus lignarius TaxID=156445 RepID=A0A224XUD0_9HEMI